MTEPLTKAQADAAWDAAVVRYMDAYGLSKGAAALALSYSDAGRRLYLQCRRATEAEAMAMRKGRYGG